MEEAARLPLVAWESFYVIVGSSGAALTGLQFVVIALVAESRKRSTLKEIDAFGTPTIVHFCAVLLVAAILSAPWRGLLTVSIAGGVRSRRCVLWINRLEAYAAPERLQSGICRLAVACGAAAQRIRVAADRQYLPS